MPLAKLSKRLMIVLVTPVQAKKNIRVMSCSELEKAKKFCLQVMKVGGGVCIVGS